MSISPRLLLALIYYRPIIPPLSPVLYGVSRKRRLALLLAGIVPGCYGDLSDHGRPYAKSAIREHPGRH